MDSQITQIKAQLNTLPDGKLICTRNGNYSKWYTSDGHNVKHLPKAKRPLAEQLAYKKYLTCKLDDCEKEKRALAFYLKHHSQTGNKLEQLLHNESGFQELLSPLFEPQNQSLSDWMHTPYEHNTQHPEQLIITTSNGTRVRSKSEAMIHMHLHIKQIPFRYECALRLGNITVFPDFTIRHPKTGEIYYWEHFGLIDDPKYSQSAFSKQQLYVSHGIIPSINLITSYETSDHPLNPNTINRIITQYFDD